MRANTVVALMGCQKVSAALVKKTRLTSLTSLMCGMCRIITWPSLGSQYESPNRGSMRHNTTVPDERSVKWKTVFRISILLSVQKSVFAKSFHNACIRSTHHLHHKMWNNPYETWWIGPKKFQSKERDTKMTIAVDMFKSAGKRVIKQAFD